MAWQDQGRQEHGYFGSGTGDGAGDDVGDLAQRARSVAGGVIAALPAAMRARSGVRLTGVAAGRLAAALEAWGKGAGLDRMSFAQRFFGRDADDKVAGVLHAAALRLATARTFSDLRAAADHVAAAVQSVGIESWSRFVRDAEDHALQHPALAGPIALGSASGIVLARSPAASPGSAAHPADVHAAVHSSPKEVSAAQRERNIEALGRIIQSEIGGNQAGAAAVGWTVKNRMLRNGTNDVHAVERRFAYDQPSTQASRAVAAGVLDGTIPDPTQGATHFYTPNRMPKETDRNISIKIDIGGGLEQVPGIVNTDNHLTRTFRPGWTLVYEQRLVPAVEEKKMKFYRAPGNDRVH